MRERPWRVMPLWKSTPDPKKILGRDGRVVVVSVEKDDANLIVEAVNAWGDTDALRRRIAEIEADT